LLPVESESILVTEPLKPDVEIGDFEFMVERPHDMVVKGLSAELFRAFVGEAARVADAVICEVEIL
jgi:hypothetical protein